MSNPRYSRAVAWLMLSILLVLLGYPLSFGPACWLADRGVIPIEAVPAGYAPLISTMKRVEPTLDALLWYAELGCREGSFTPLILLISTSVEGSTGDLIDDPDDIGLPEADEDVILDEAPA